MKEYKNVKFFLRDTIYIEDTVEIGENVIVYPNNILLGKTVVESSAILLPGNIIKDSVIKSGAEITQSNLDNGIIGENSKIGPFARIRPNSIIGKNCKIGNFVEIKNSILHNGVKASHLAYIGDSEVGENVNVGCGAIFVNFNGKEKNRVKVGTNSFIGSNVNLIAPLEIAPNSYICAGTTVTKNTKSGDFVIGREREIVKPKLAKKYLKEFKGD